MQVLLAAAALFLVSTGEVQTFKHIGDHAAHTHEHHKRSARKQGE